MIVTTGAAALAHIYHDFVQSQDAEMLGFPVADWYSLSKHDRMVLSSAMQRILDSGFVEEGPNFVPTKVMEHAHDREWKREGGGVW